MTSLLRPENVIHVKYIITVLVIEPIILHTFARLREDSARISRGFVFEAGIADAVCRREMACESLQWLPPQISAYFINHDNVLTLINPPSGFALLKAGCALIFGCKSDTDLSLVNSGTGPRPGGPIAACGIGLRGDFGSLPKTAFNCCVAEAG